MHTHSRRGSDPCSEISASSPRRRRQPAAIGSRPAARSSRSSPPWRSPRSWRVRRPRGRRGWNDGRRRRQRPDHARYLRRLPDRRPPRLEPADPRQPARGIQKPAAGRGGCRVPGGARPWRERDARVPRGDGPTAAQRGRQRRLSERPQVQRGRRPSPGSAAGAWRRAPGVRSCRRVDPRRPDRERFQARGRLGLLGARGVAAHRPGGAGVGGRMLPTGPRDAVSGRPRSVRHVLDHTRIARGIREPGRHRHLRTEQQGRRQLLQRGRAAQARGFIPRRRCSRSTSTRSA